MIRDEKLDSVACSLGTFFPRALSYVPAWLIPCHLAFADLVLHTREPGEVFQVNI